MYKTNVLDDFKSLIGNAEIPEKKFLKYESYDKSTGKSAYYYGYNRKEI